MLIRVGYYDGKTSRRHDVILEIRGDRASVRGDGVDRDAPLGDLTVSEAMGEAPRLITFPDGAFCEVTDGAGLAAILEATGYDEGVVARWQRHVGWVAGSLAAIVLFAWIAYVYGVPAVAAVVAEHLPQDAVEALGQGTLQALDSQVFLPSTIPAARQQALVRRFEAMPESAAVRHEIVFRDGRKVGPNAFALPSGTIVVTDQLVNLAPHDEAILGVLAHELGHLAHRHAVRMVLEATVVGLAVTWYVGDASGLLASAPTAVLNARYSRVLEQEADDYAAGLLRSNGMTPAVLADMLEALEHARTEGRNGQRAPGKATDFLASHPATAERIRKLRGRAAS